MTVEGNDRRWRMTMSKLNEIDEAAMTMVEGRPSAANSILLRLKLPTGQQIDTGKRVAVTEPHFGRQSAVCG